MIYFIRNAPRMASTKIPPPRDPTAQKHYKSIMSDEEMKIILDPKGFMSEEEKLAAQFNTPGKEQNIVQASSQQKPAMPPEYGFKPKGLEPTRYGDWQVNGKCTDF